ncbi:hypothetical protein OG520_18735 [Streptomyces sp. NBC_00984]|uniref:hypothetical protein n=1 Tax=Streptomyces sp. NBC_00984 TaxID=2903700 RepID=UPI003865355E|nr:hypothetical protein OG520_18735 [Streptomyces sp. NBC_00984]
MATDEQAHVSSLHGDLQEQYRQDADRIEKWSMLWMLVTIGMWVWFLFLLLVPYDAGGTSCQAPLFHPAQENGGACRSDVRQWPVLLGVLALAVLPTLVAAVTSLYAKLLFRIVRASAGNATDPSAPSS